MLGAFQDITERRRVQDELSQARERELLIGSRIQQALLVDPPDQRLPGLWLSTLSQASQRIDGDFIELISLGDHGVNIIVGDVMGKGAAAALMAAATKMQLNRCVAELVSNPAVAGALPTPADVVAAVHRAMTHNLQELEAFVTLSYVRLDTRAGTVTWVGCGSEEPVLLRADGEVLGLANQHPPMGVLNETAFQQHTQPFRPGDVVFMCSDGAADALLPDGSRLGHAQVMAVLSGLLGQVSTPAAVLHALRAELTRLGARFTDDLTLALAISAGDTALASRRELGAGLDDLPHVRGLVEARCRQAGLDEVPASLFTLACVEAYTNAVRHTVGRPAGAPVELVVRTEPERLVVDIVTLGEAFTPEPTVRETDFADFPEGGFGLNIMAQATDGVEHWHALGVNMVRLTHRRPAA
jgi:serine phosphatase RsbU (regulator of sigma subunit)/anti-sigma regulatory factor (Ser/Thr protein kinase)